MQPDGMLAKPLSMLPGGVDIAAKCASWLGQQLADAEHVAVLRDLTNLARKALGVLQFCRWMCAQERGFREARAAWGATPGVDGGGPPDHRSVGIGNACDADGMFRERLPASEAVFRERGAVFPNAGLRSGTLLPPLIPSVF